MADERQIFDILETSDGNGASIPQGIEGSAAPANTAPILVAKDENGDIQYLPMVGGKLVVDAGAVSVGTEQAQSAFATPASLNTDTDVCTLLLTASTTYDCTDVMASSFKPVLWRVIWDDNGTPNELLRFVTGSGDLTHTSDMKRTFTTGAAGAQVLKIVGSQISGKLSDMHGVLKAVERA